MIKYTHVLHSYNMAIPNKDGDGEDVEKSEPSYTDGGNIKWNSNFGTVWQFLKILNIVLTFESIMPLLGIKLREMKTYFNTNTCT